jgi:hypothetical protein|tara:strand:- start:94 stop:510 length:417 start_codon:yes stop_codon:yes gene_type:complete
MKQLFLSLFIVLFVTSVHAGALATLTSTPQDNNTEETTPQTTPEQPSVPPVMVLPAMIECSPPMVIMSMINKYNEIPFIVGTTMVKRPDGVQMPAKMVMYVNMQNRTYTLVAQMPGDVFWCVIQAGGNFAPAQNLNGT